MIYVFMIYGLDLCDSRLSWQGHNVMRQADSFILRCELWGLKEHEPERHIVISTSIKLNMEPQAVGAVIPF